MTGDTPSTVGSTLTARDVLASPAVLAFLLSQFVVTTGVMLQAAALVSTYMTSQVMKSTLAGSALPNFFRPQYSFL